MFVLLRWMYSRDKAPLIVQQSRELVCVTVLIQRGQWWERPHQRFSSHVRACMCACVCVMVASFPELKEPASDRKHRYCAKIDCVREPKKRLKLEVKWTTTERMNKQKVTLLMNSVWACFVTSLMYYCIYGL